MTRNWILGLAPCLLPACGGAGSSGGSPVDPGPGSVAGVVGDLVHSGHVLRRAAFGPTPELLDQLTLGGTGPWLNQQLDPESIDLAQASELQALLVQIPVPTSEHDQPTMAQLVQYQIARALHSPAQLQEQMTDFWENHFSTSWYQVLPYTGSPETTNWLEWRENELFRAGALGRFRDLLVDSATSPAMLIMLDNVINVAGNPNLNYARELLELHTLGQDKGYTEADIAEVARCFTGWTLCRVEPADAGDPLAPESSSPNSVWSFHFDPSKHDDWPKLLFIGKEHELLIPARSGNAGLQDGFDVLDVLARSPRTAEFVCTKLIHKFVSDAAPQDLVQQCKQVWKQTHGSIREVLVTIFNSPHFRAHAVYRGKVATPLESLCGTLRALEAEVDSLWQLTTIHLFLDGPLGQALFRWPTPDGYPEAGDEQLGTAKVLERMRFNQLAQGGGPGDPHYDLRALLSGRQVPLGDPGAIVDFLAWTFLQGEITASERQAALDFLLTDLAGAPAALDPAASDYDSRVGLCAAFVASFPCALQQ